MRRPAQASASRSASANGTPGSPQASTELARPLWLFPARSTHSPSRARRIPGQVRSSNRSSSSGDDVGVTVVFQASISRW